MLRIRKANDRGHAGHGWLSTYHTFSFADYYDPQHIGFQALRVINEDRVQPGRGFPTHPHRYSMGNGSIIRPGEVQRMSAGTGIDRADGSGQQLRSHRSC